MGILFCRKKKKAENKIEKLNQLIFVNEDVNVFEIKRALKQMKNDIRTIKILKCQSNLDRFESVDVLLLREDLQVSDFPKLQSVTIDFIKKKGNIDESGDKVLKSNFAFINNKNKKQNFLPGMKMAKSQFDLKKSRFNTNYKQQDQSQQNNQIQVSEYAQSNIQEEFSHDKLDEKLYEKALKTMHKDVRIHLLLRYTIQLEQIVINQMAFKDKRAFLYVMRKMKQLNCTIRRIVFKDIITLKKNIFLTICLQMREIQNLDEIQIINTNIMHQQVIQLQHLLCWMQKQIKVLVISGANLIDEHIDILFFQKFSVFDFYQLEKLELKNCPQLWKSDKYILLMKQYSQLKLNQKVNKTLKLECIDLKLPKKKSTLEENKNKEEQLENDEKEINKGNLQKVHEIKKGQYDQQTNFLQKKNDSIHQNIQEGKNILNTDFFKDTFSEVNQAQQESKKGDNKSLQNLDLNINNNHQNHGQKIQMEQQQSNQTQQNNNSDTSDIKINFNFGQQNLIFTPISNNISSFQNNLSPSQNISYPIQNTDSPIQNTNPDIQNNISSNQNLNQPFQKSIFQNPNNNYFNQQEIQNQIEINKNNNNQDDAGQKIDKVHKQNEYQQSQLNINQNKLDDINLQFQKQEDCQENLHLKNNEQGIEQNHKMVDIQKQELDSNRREQESERKLETQSELQDEVSNQRSKRQEDVGESEVHSRMEIIQEDQKYDNRHERHFLIGQYLWQTEKWRMIDNNDFEQMQQIENTQNNQISLSTIQGNLIDKNMSTQDTQFFSQFFKSCIRELMDIDMCKILDLSGLSYQNFNIDQKKQICQYIVSSNTIQIFIIQYDRQFFKELCEQISNKYKTKKQALLEQYKNKLTKSFNSKNMDEINNLIQNPQVYFSNNIKTNLFSLESIKIISSKFDQFQFDSFCYISFLSLFILSIEIDFQKQEIEDQSVFPSHEQILFYLKKMVTIQTSQSDSGHQEEDDDEEAIQKNIQKNYLEQQLQKQRLAENQGYIYNRDTIIEKDTQNIKTNQNLENGQPKKEENKVSISQMVSSESQKSQYQKNTPSFKNTVSDQKSISYSNYIFDTIKQYQELFDLSTSVQDVSLKNFSWQNVQNSNDKSFSQFIFTYFSLTAESIMNLDFDYVSISHTCLSKLQEIIRKVVQKYVVLNQKGNNEHSSILNFRETQEINNLINNFKNQQQQELQKQQQQYKSSQDSMKSINEQKEQVHLFKNLKTQRSIFSKGSKIFNMRQTASLSNTKRQMSSLSNFKGQQDPQRLSSGQLDKIQLDQKKSFRSSLTNNQGSARGSLNDKQIQKSILEMNRTKTKSKYFLNKFRIKFVEIKLMNIKTIIQLFGQVCKQVEIINASCYNSQQWKQIQMLQQHQKAYIDSLATSKNLSQSVVKQQNLIMPELPDIVLKKAKLGIAGLTTSQGLYNLNQSSNSSSQSLNYITIKENESMKRSLNRIKQQNNIDGQSENQSKYVLTSIKLVDYPGFSHVNIVEINNQIEDLSELILIRCNLSLFQLKQIVQKLNRFKSLKKLVIMGNQLSLEQDEQIQINQGLRLYGQQTSEYRSSNTIEWSKESPLVGNPIQKRFSVLPKRSSLNQQKSIRNIVQNILNSEKTIYSEHNQNINSNSQNLLEEIDQEKVNLETFKYCIEKIFSTSTLKYLDISCNQICDKQGKVILDELVSRSLKLLEYRLQQSQLRRNSVHQQLKKSSFLEQQNQQNNSLQFNSPIKLQSTLSRQDSQLDSFRKSKKSGFYSKFIEQQLNSNISQRNSDQTTKLSKLRHLNTNFFANQDEEEPEKQESQNSDLSEDESLNDDLSVESSESRSSSSKTDSQRSQSSSSSQSKSSSSSHSKRSSQDIRSKSNSSIIINNDKLKDQNQLQTEEGLLNEDKNEQNHENFTKKKQKNSSQPLERATPIKKVNPKQKIQNKLEDIPENELERLESQSQAFQTIQYENQEENKKSKISKFANQQIITKQSTFKKNSLNQNAKIQRIKREDLNTPELIELYIQNNEFNQKTIRNITKQIGILFSKLKILDISSTAGSKKQRKSVMQNQQKQTRKQNMLYSHHQLFKENQKIQKTLTLKNQTSIEPAQEKQESEGTEETHDINKSSSSKNTNTANQNSNFSKNQDELDIQRRQQFEKTLKYPNSTPEFQDLEKLIMKDTNWLQLNSGKFQIKNIFLLSNLSEIDLSGCINTDEIADRIAQNANNFIGCPLRILSLNKNKHLHRQSWRNLIGCFINKFSSLEVINLSDCGINEERIKGILDAFSDLEREISLVELNLSKNIRLAGVLRTFIFVLTQIYYIRLQVLDLSECGINDQSCEEMIQGLLYGKKKRLSMINTYLMSQDKEKQNQYRRKSAWCAGQGDFKEVKKEIETTNFQSENISKSYQQSFSLIKLALNDNQISMKMNFLAQYCFVFQLTDEDNILFSMQFNCNNEQKKNMNRVFSELKNKKGLIYSHLYDHLLEEYSVSSQSLVLGKHLFQNRKVTEDIILNCLRTFNSIKKLKLFINDKVVSILNQISNSTQSQILEQDYLQSQIVSNNMGIHAQTIVQSQELKTFNTKQTIPTIKSSTENQNKGHIYIVRDKKRGTKKFTLIPKQRQEGRVVTQLPHEYKNKDLEKQITLPVQMSQYRRFKKNQMNTQIEEQNEFKNQYNHKDENQIQKKIIQEKYYDDISLKEQKKGMNNNDQNNIDDTESAYSRTKEQNNHEDVESLNLKRRIIQEFQNECNQNSKDNEKLNKYMITSKKENRNPQQSPLKIKQQSQQNKLEDLRKNVLLLNLENQDVESSESSCKKLQTPPNLLNRYKKRSNSEERQINFENLSKFSFQNQDVIRQRTQSEDPAPIITFNSTEKYNFSNNKKKQSNQEQQNPSLNYHVNDQYQQNSQTNISYNDQHSTKKQQHVSFRVEQLNFSQQEEINTNYVDQHEFENLQSNRSSHDESENNLIFNQLVKYDQSESNQNQSQTNELDSQKKVQIPKQSNFNKLIDKNVENKVNGNIISPYTLKTPDIPIAKKKSIIKNSNLQLDLTSNEDWKKSFLTPNFDNSNFLKTSSNKSSFLNSPSKQKKIQIFEFLKLDNSPQKDSQSYQSVSFQKEYKDSQYNKYQKQDYIQQLKDTSSQKDNISHQENTSKKDSIYQKDNQSQRHNSINRSNENDMIDVQSNKSQNKSIRQNINVSKNNYKRKSDPEKQKEGINDILGLGNIKKQQSLHVGELNSQQMHVNDKYNCYQDNIIHLGDIDSLVLQSQEKVGIISLLDFFSIVSDNLKSIDFSQIQMSHSMFVRTVFKLQDIFSHIIDLKFANLNFEQNASAYLYAQTSQAIFSLLTMPKIEKLSFINCSFSQTLLDTLILQYGQNEQSKFFIKELNFSKNKNLSFSKEIHLILLERVEKLVLSDCNLNENKLFININLWTRRNLQNLQELDLSYNKGLSSKFFCHLGEYISQVKTMLKLDISYTAMYDEKQRQFSYGLNYKNGITQICLVQLFMKEIRFSKKEGTLMLFKALVELPSLEILDMSDMQMSNYQELDILHNYLRYEYIGKFNRVRKFYLQNCSFLFEAVPYYDFDSRYSLLEYNHCSLFLLSQFDNITHLDLSGCLQHQKTSRKFLQELDIMRRKKLINYSIRYLNISKNLISSENIRICLCNILFLLKNLQTLNIRTNVRYESNYAYNILEALDSYQYFLFFQNQSNLNQNDADLNFAETFQRIYTKTHPQMNLNNINDSDDNKQSGNNMLNNSPQNKYFSSVQNNSVFQSIAQNNSNIISKFKQQVDYQTLLLTELIFSDISSDLVNNKENINLLLDVCIVNKNFQNLKKLIINQEYQASTNIIRLQNAYTESLLEINEKYNLQEVCQDLNTDISVGFKFKDASQIIYLKPEMQQITATNKDEKKKSFRFTSTSFYGPLSHQLSTSGQTIQQLSAISQPNQNPSKKIIQISFTKMKIEYVDSNFEEESMTEDRNETHFLIDSMINDRFKHFHFNINEQNEYLFHTFTSENEENQIELWRQFYPFLKKINNPQQYTKTHISLNYLDTNLKLLSSTYNIFIDNKFDFTQNVQVLLSDVDSLYLGHQLYHFFVQVCSFKPQNDLIDFLIEYLLFISQKNNQDLINKRIRLPPFLILNEEDAQRIQQAFVNIQKLKSEQKKFQNMFVSVFRRDKPSLSNHFSNSPQAKNTLVLKQSMREDSLTNQRNKVLQQLKTIIDKKRNEYSTTPASPGPLSSQIRQPSVESRRRNSLLMMKDDQNKIVCNYFYKSKKGCEEYDEITKLKKMPPSTLNIDNFSVNGLKAVYMICYHNDYFIKSDIDFESIMFVSTSLSFSLREYFYQEYTSQKRSYFKSIFYKVMYIIMDIFVDVDSYFKYDESILALDSNLEQSKKSTIFFAVMVFTFYVICFVLSPMLAFFEVGPRDSDNLSYISHATFLVYVIISLIFEIFFLRKVLALTRHLIPDINLVHQNNIIARIRDSIFEFFMNIEIFSYKDFFFYQQIIFSFLSQLDMYQDICFIYVTYHQEDYVISFLAALIIVVNKTTDILFFIKMTNKNSYCNLFFQSISTVYEYSTQGYLEGLSNILDVISPHNVLRITQNIFTKCFLPSKAIGLTINKQIFYRVKKVIACDLPQILLQFLFAFRNLEKNSANRKNQPLYNKQMKQITHFYYNEFIKEEKQTLNLFNCQFLYIKILIFQIYKQNLGQTFNNAKCSFNFKEYSVLNQMDFDELSEQKAQFLQQQFTQYQQKEIEMFDKINSNVEQLGARNIKKPSNHSSEDSISNDIQQEEDRVEQDLFKLDLQPQNKIKFNFNLNETNDQNKIPLSKNSSK